MLVLSPLLQLSTLLRNADMTDAWWRPVCITLFVASGAALILTATTAFRSHLRAVAIVVAVVQVLVLALWFPARTGVLAAPDDINPIWVSGGVSLVAIGLAATIDYFTAISYLVVTLTLLFAVYSYAHAGELIAAESLRATVSGALVGLFVAVVRAAVLAARRVDADRERVLAVAAAGAARTARGRERERLDAVVRDEVVAVLRTVRAGEPAQMQREQAVIALAALDGSADARPPVIDPQTAQLRLRETVVAHGDHIAVAVDVDDEADDYPVDVIDTLVDASGEAVLNSLQHAGEEASQVVVGRLSREGIRLRVVDDGIGFNPDRILPDRMGIAMGIRGRMARLPGGSARIESDPGAGAMVSLEWRRP